jgi:hypothetical protein
MPRRCRDRNPGSLSRELLSAFSIRIVIPVQLDKIYRTRCARNYTRYPGVYAHIGAFFRYVTPARYFRARGAPNKEPGAEEQGVPGLDPLVLSLSLSLSLRDGEPRGTARGPTSLFATLLRFEAPPGHPPRLNSTCLSVSCSARSPVSISGGLLQTKAKSEQRSLSSRGRLPRVIVHRGLCSTRNDRRFSRTAAGQQAEIANKGNARVDVGVSAVFIPPVLPADDSGETEGGTSSAARELLTRASCIYVNMYSNNISEHAR